MLKSGHMGRMTPPIYRSVSGSALHTVPHEQPPQKTFLACMGPIDPLKNFLQKSPLTGPTNFHTVWAGIEKDKDMANWARLCEHMFEEEVWVNEDSVERLINVVRSGDVQGCKIFFKDGSSEMLQVLESSDDILALWSRWYEGNIIKRLEVEHAEI